MPAPAISSKFHETLASVIRQMALVGDEEQRSELCRHAKSYKLKEWKNGLTMKVTGVGLATGLVPGPPGIGVELLDITYLLAATGRACYGVGYIIRGDVDYDKDMALILAKWAGGAEAATIGVGGKVAVKVGGKLGIVFGTAAASKVGGKMLAKVAPKVAAKLIAKVGSKFAASWVPFLGSAISGGINWWVATSLMEAAEAYYRSEFIEIDSELFEDLKDMKDHYFELSDDPAA